MRASGSLSRKLTLPALAPVLALGLTQCVDLPTALLPPASCVEGQLSSGASYRICTPKVSWNGALVLFTPGIVAPFPDPNIPPPPPTLDSDLQEALSASGYAVAMTGFREKGVARLPDWILDLTELVTTFENARGKPKRTYLTGGSQGGLLTTLAVEQQPAIFSGGLAACGPIGDYQQQIDYIGDFRVAFDYFFGPGNPRWPIWTSTQGAGEPKDWDDWVGQLAADEIAANPDKIQQLLDVTAAPIARADPNSMRQGVLNVLSYSFLYTNDLVSKVGGLPYDNTGRLLQIEVARFNSKAALDNYETTGQLSRPLVTLHTTGDEIVPYWHEELYWQKVLQNPDSYRLHANLEVQRDGHCDFTVTEMLAAFSLLVLMVDGQNMVIAKDALPSPAARAELLRLARQYGAEPEIVDRSVIGLRAEP